MTAASAEQFNVTATSETLTLPTPSSSSPSSSPSSSTTGSPSSTPKYFAAHQYEYEVSPEQSTEQTPKSTTTSTTTTSSQRSPSPYIITETSLPMTKTIYLIRHAESDENRRKKCLKTSVKGLGKLKLPKREDVVASMELMNVGAQLDSNVSPRGQAQIDQLGGRIANDDFVRKMGIQLVAHSPLQRARRTSYGMLQSVAPASNNNQNQSNSNINCNGNDTTYIIDDDEQTNPDPTIKGAKHPSVKRVVELDILSERTPIEWLPIQHDQFTKRIAEFEMWLCQQPEDVIAVVGHSQYFKDMLGLETKFHNVDVWSLQFDFTVENSIQKVRQDVHVANESEKKKKIQKHFENLGSMIQKKKRSASDTINSIQKGKGGKVGNDSGSGSGASGSGNGDNSDCRNEGANGVNNSTDEDEKEDLENRDENDTTGNENPTGTQTSIDDTSLEELELPRGWRQLKHHYRFSPDYTSTSSTE